MNRFKFRVWDKLNKEFLDRSEFVISPFRDCTYLPSGDSGDDFIIQQYTELEDKNGKAIYEGDIIMNEADHDDAAMCVVGWSVYEEIGWALYYDFREPMEPLRQNFNGIDLYEEYPMTYNRGNCYEVIGNVFENIKLLK